jgi:hypothetical protein
MGRALRDSFDMAHALSLSVADQVARLTCGMFDKYRDVSGESNRYRVT